MDKFQYPFLLGLLLFVPLAVWREWIKSRLLKLPVSHIGIFRSNKPLSWRKRFEWFWTLPFSLSLISLVIAAAGPVREDVLTESEADGIDILLVLDTSGSMRALDMELKNTEVMRIDAVKEVVTHFIKGRPHDRIGMVVFGSDAFTQCPLTTDHQTLQGYLDFVEAGMAGEDTAIGQAIALGIKRFTQSESKSKVMILLTDGKSTSGSISPEAAAEAALARGIKIYSIGVGSDNETVPIMVQTYFGPRKQRVKLEMDEETLKKISEKTGGSYFRATTTDMLREIYERIDALEKTEIEQKDFVLSESVASPFFAISYLMFLLHFLLRLFVFRRLP